MYILESFNKNKYINWSLENVRYYIYTTIPIDVFRYIAIND